MPRSDPSTAPLEDIEGGDNESWRIAIELLTLAIKGRESPLPAERSLCLPWSATEFHSVDAEDRLICRACGTECLTLTTYVYSHITTSFEPGAPSIAPPQRARMRHSTVYVESSVCSTQARPGQGSTVHS